jgi:hypothetical protein
MTTPTPPETLRARRGHEVYPPEDIRAQVPRLGTGDETPAGECIVWAHWFAGGSDWYLMEADWSSGMAFGWVCLNEDAQNAELGEFFLPEMEAVLAHGGLLVVERDLHWEPRPAKDAGMPGWVDL